MKAEEDEDDWRLRNRARLKKKEYLLAWWKKQLNNDPLIAKAREWWWPWLFYEAWTTEYKNYYGKGWREKMSQYMEYEVTPDPWMLDENKIDPKDKKTYLRKWLESRIKEEDEEYVYYLFKWWKKWNLYKWWTETALKNSEFLKMARAAWWRRLFMEELMKEYKNYYGKNEYKPKWNEVKKMNKIPDPWLEGDKNKQYLLNWAAAQADNYVLIEKWKKFYQPAGKKTKAIKQNTRPEKKEENI